MFLNGREKSVYRKFVKKMTQVEEYILVRVKQNEVCKGVERT